MKIILKSLIVLFTIISISAQTEQERAKIISEIDLQKSEKLQSILENNFQESQLEIQSYLERHPNIPTKYEQDGVLYEIRGIDQNQPIYVRTMNEGSSKTLSTDKLYDQGGLGLNIQGQNMVGGVWDGGKARVTHQELSNQFIVSAGSSIGDHPTHVTGTIAAKGVQPQAKGVAFNAKIYGQDWTNDFPEMQQFALQGYLTSNHSYGYDASTIGQYKFGAYDSEATQLDLMLNTYKYYLPVIAAGNDRDNYLAYNPTKNGYDLISGMSCAKNALSVGAIYEVQNYINSSSVIMSSFSNWGPTDDGRIKPDLVAQGVSVYSCIATNDTSYASWPGTSMAAPSITAMVLLLQQYYGALNSDYMKSATVKGLMLHTTKEAGITIGPDYRFGWGLPDAVAAVAVISGNLDDSLIEETSLAQGEEYHTTVEASGTEPLKVSISWNDPYGQANNGTVDDPTPSLVNDLDVRVVQNGVTYYPWKLNPASPGLSASQNSTNDVDNFERVDIPAASGTYDVYVSHKGNLSGNSQEYTLIVSGGSPLGVEDINSLNNEMEIYPNPVNNLLYLKSDNDFSSSKVNIYNAAGMIVSQNKITGDNTIEVSNLTPGNYVLVIQNGDNKIVKKFIKQ